VSALRISESSPPAKILEKASNLMLFGQASSAEILVQVNLFKEQREQDGRRMERSDGVVTTAFNARSQLA